MYIFALETPMRSSTFDCHRATTEKDLQTNTVRIYAFGSLIEYIIKQWIVCSQLVRIAIIAFKRILLDALTM